MPFVHQKSDPAYIWEQLSVFGPNVSQLLFELGFPVSLYTLYALHDNEKLVSYLALFIYRLNSAYQIYPGEDLTEDFSITSLCEPWLLKFLVKALECQQQERFAQC